MSEKFTEGQEVYDGHGCEYIYVGCVGGKHAARPWYEVGSDSQLADEPIFVSELFATVPVQKRSDTLAALESQIAEKRAELRSVSAEVQATSAERSAMLARLKQREALRRIDDFIEGRMTHVVTLDYNGVAIKSISTMEKEGESYDRGIRLISLYGNSKGDLHWQINRYKDDSGNWAEIWPCCSESEAMEKAAEVLARELGTQECPAKGCTRMIASAQKLGLPVPQWVLDLKRAGERAMVAGRISTLEKSLADERAKLDGIEGSAQ